MRNQHLFLALAGASVLTFSSLSNLHASFLDDPTKGFGLTVDAYPAEGLTATLSNGDIVTFDGSVISRYDDQGTFLSNLATLPASVAGSFLVSAPDESFVLLGENSLGNVYRVDIALGGETLLTTLPSNYDAAFETSTTAIVSAPTCGTDCGNELYRVNMVTGATTLIATVGGSPGPVEVEANGDLLYGRVSQNTALGGFQILRFAASELSGSPVATEADATTVGNGFDGFGDLVHDPIDGEIYLAENHAPTGINRIRWVRGDQADSPVLLDGAPGNTLDNLEFVPGNGSAQYRSFQPASGGSLRFNTTNFSTIFNRKRLEGLRPSLAFSGPGSTGAGNLTMTVTDGYRDGFAVMLYGPTALFNRNEMAISLAILEAPLFTGLDFGTLIIDPNIVSLDGFGVGQLVLPTDGGLVGLITGQALVLDVGFRPIQISSSADL